jgi:hypothetical protein
MACKRPKTGLLVITRFINSNRELQLQIGRFKGWMPHVDRFQNRLENPVYNSPNGQRINPVLMVWRTCLDGLQGLTQPLVHIEQHVALYISPFHSRLSFRLSLVSHVVINLTGVTSDKSIYQQ